MMMMRMMMMIPMISNAREKN
jgi:hypothetical protein